ncbi:MAG: ATP-binding protein, partial [Gemmatimonadales bacterium]
MASVILTLLGQPAVSLADGRPVLPQPGAKALALLTYLVLEARPHTREELAGLLWGESPEPEARASLRQALKQLRALLGGGVHGDRAVIELADPPACDVAQFRTRVAHDPKSVLDIDIPRFLAGFSVRHAPQFDEWVAATRAGLLQQYQQALGALGREAMGQWRWHDAISLADRWLAADPLSEEAARLGVEARYLSGDRGAALARFAEYRSALQREVGCEPSRALMGLVRRIETDSGSAGSRPITDEWYAHAPSFESPLIGREAEWERLQAAWKATRKGGGRIVLLESEAGVGKSRLGEEFVRRVVADGGTLLRGRGYDARSGVPYEPVVETLRDALEAPGLTATSPEWLTEVARLLPELRQRFPTLPEPAPATDSAEAWRLFEGIAQILSAVAGERPVVVLLDDLHWCDDDSCNLIRFLSRRLERAPVLWLGLVTLGEMERDAPSARLCRVLRARAQAETLALQPLSEDQIWRMIREMGHVSTPTGARRFANRIHRVTSGNPFYVIELLKTMFAQGLLAMEEQSGEWTVSAEAMAVGHEILLSRTVQDVIAERVDRLPDELREVLITIAVSGAGCSPEVVSHVHGISRLHAAAVADALIERRLVNEEGETYRCTHPVIAHVVRDGLTAPRRQEVHRSLALSLERVTS